MAEAGPSSQQTQRAELAQRWERAQRERAPSPDEDWRSDSGDDEPVPPGGYLQFGSSSPFAPPSGPSQAEQARLYAAAARIADPGTRDAFLKAIATRRDGWGKTSTIDVSDEDFDCVGIVLGPAGGTDSRMDTKKQVAQAYADVRGAAEVRWETVGHGRRQPASFAHGDQPPGCCGGG